MNVEHALAKQGNELMESVHLTIGSESQQAIALDGHRISVRGAVTDRIREVNISGEFLRSVLKLIDGELNFEVDEEDILVKGPGVRIFGKTTDGKYFNVDQFLNAPPLSIQLQVSRAEMLENLKVLTMVSQNVILEIKKEREVVMSSREATHDATCSIDGTGTLKPIKIGFNGKYLQEAFSSIEDEEVTMEMEGPRSPIYMRGEKWLEMILPVNIR